MTSRQNNYNNNNYHLQYDASVAEDSIALTNYGVSPTKSNSCKKLSRHINNNLRSKQLSSTNVALYGEEKSPGLREKSSKRAGIVCTKHPNYRLNLVKHEDVKKVNNRTEDHSAINNITYQKVSFTIGPSTNGSNANLDSAFHVGNSLQSHSPIHSGPSSSKLNRSNNNSSNSEFENWSPELSSLTSYSNKPFSSIESLMTSIDTKRQTSSGHPSSSNVQQTIDQPRHIERTQRVRQHRVKSQRKVKFDKNKNTVFSFIAEDSDNGDSSTGERLNEISAKVSQLNRKSRVGLRKRIAKAFKLPAAIPLSPPNRAVNTKILSCDELYGTLSTMVPPQPSPKEISNIAQTCPEPIDVIINPRKLSEYAKEWIDKDMTHDKMLPPSSRVFWQEHNRHTSEDYSSSSHICCQRAAAKRRVSRRKQGIRTLNETSPYHLIKRSKRADREEACWSASRATASHAYNHLSDNFYHYYFQIVYKVLANHSVQHKKYRKMIRKHKLPQKLASVARLFKRSPEQVSKAQNKQRVRDMELQECFWIKNRLSHRRQFENFVNLAIKRFVQLERIEKRRGKGKLNFSKSWFRKRSKYPENMNIELKRELIRYTTYYFFMYPTHLTLPNSTQTVQNLMRHVEAKYLLYNFMIYGLVEKDHDRLDRMVPTGRPLMVPRKYNQREEALLI